VTKPLYQRGCAVLRVIIYQTVLCHRESTPWFIFKKESSRYTANVEKVWYYLRRAVNKKNERKLFFDGINFWRNFTVQMFKFPLNRKKLVEGPLQYRRPTAEAVWNNFMNKRVTVTSKVCLLYERTDSPQSHVTVLATNTTSSECKSTNFDVQRSI